MFILDNLNDQNGVLVINKNSINVYLFQNNNESNLIEKITFKHDVQVTTATYSAKSNLLGFTDANKKFHLIKKDKENECKSICTKLTNKRASKLLFDKQESCVILGDKTGDVYLLDIRPENIENAEFKLIMGHLSMLTDMTLSGDEKLLFTSDRDEKIRISFFPNSYNIKGYLLSHKEFISQIQLINSNRLLSTSGDSKLILWNLELLKPIQVINVQEYDQKVAAEDQDPIGVQKFDFNLKNNVLLLHLFRNNSILHFKYSDDDGFNFISKIDMKIQIETFVRIDNSHYLIASFSSDSKNTFSVKKFENNQLNDLNDKDQQMKDFEMNLNLDVNVENGNDVKNELENEYLSYFKAKVNNLEDYYEKKKERIETTAVKRKRTKSNNSESYEDSVEVV